MNSLSSIREAILAELNPILLRREQLAEEDQTLAEAEERLEGALKELDGRSAKKSKGKSKGPVSRKNRKSSVKKEQVQPVCLALVEANPGIEGDVLAGLAAEKLEQQGFSRNGLTMQIDKCIKSRLFTVANDGSVSIANGEAQARSDSSPDGEPNGLKLPVESSTRFRKQS